MGQMPKMRSLAQALRRKRFARFSRDERGVAAVEFALVLPIMAIILLGCFEVPRFVMIYQKIARASAGVADLVAQADDPITADQLTDVYSAAQMMMQPYDLKTNGKVIISSINNVNGSGVTMTWQRSSGSASATSRLGAQGSNPSSKLPTGLSPASNQEVLAAEVYFNYTPIFKTQIFNGSQLSVISYTRPRNHNLQTTPP